jgi:hypothetical protein
MRIRRAFSLDVLLYVTSHVLSVGRRRQFYGGGDGGIVVQSVRDIEEASLASPHPYLPSLSHNPSPQLKSKVFV